VSRATDIVVTRWGARFMGRRFACSIGRGGITTAKREGDGATPAGVHGLTGLLYRPDRIARSALPDWALPIGPSDLWSDDPHDPDYNLMVRAPHAFGHERLTRADPLYDVILLTDWNWPRAIPGEGSAIFLHTWRRPRHPTAGCVAFARHDLLWIAHHIRHQTRIVIGT
jgi:L,D-peptidoglycan transpeptidase YkuD (ErfK/YbiS/YcfS/YnhG family)